MDAVLYGQYIKVKRKVNNSTFFNSSDLNTKTLPLVSNTGSSIILQAEPTPMWIRDSVIAIEFQVASDSNFNTIVESGRVGYTGDLNNFRFVNNLSDHISPVSNFTYVCDIINNFSPSTQYFWRYRYLRDNSRPIEWSNVNSFTTSSSFFDFSNSSNIGQPLGGGYFAGIIDTSGTRYALIVAPKASGENSSLIWKTTNTTTAGTTSLWDGWTNTNNMNNSTHPAAQFTRSLNINGYDDWYLPAKDELELLYRHFKPTTHANHTSFGANTSSDPSTSNYTSSVPGQTSITNFITGGSERFAANSYWSSMEDNSNDSWRQNFINGHQFNGNKSNSAYVRAVRRLVL